MTGVLLYYIFLYKQAKHPFFVYSLCELHDLLHHMLYGWRSEWPGFGSSNRGSWHLHGVKVGATEPNLMHLVSYQEVQACMKALH